ncbi:MAG: hypothetical protein EXR99_09740 [Gemmataceae bacterium]|nr:hypothetical protein [Gemmataceae bacterium]
MTVNCTTARRHCTRLASLSLAVLILANHSFAADGLDRLALEKLKQTHTVRESLKKQIQAPPRQGPLKEYRANLHVHSHLSHDSRGKIEEIVAAAKKAGTHILLFTEHPAPHYDFFKQGHQGLRDGVLLIPGAETAGLLAYPSESLGDFGNDTREVAALVRRKGGLAFLCHLEERMNLEVPGLTGVEIYNIHAIFKKQKRLLEALKNPLWIVQAAGRIREYPQEAYSAIHEYPADYLGRWDELCQRAPHTGVTANDAHQNVGMRVQWAGGNSVVLQDALGKKIAQVSATLLKPFVPLPANPKEGDELFRVQLDGYEYALRHAGTHLLMKDLTREEAWRALEKGQAFAGFDWIADTTGFDFHLQGKNGRVEMGDRVAWEKGLKLLGRAPLPGEWRVLRDGKVVHEGKGRALEIAILQPGVYRAEVWLEVAGEKMIWILSNPIYVKESRSGGGGI